MSADCDPFFSSKGGNHIFDIHLQWLEKNLDLGKAKNVIKAEINPREISRAILSLLEGSSFVSWALSDKVVDQSGFNLILQNIIVS